MTLKAREVLNDCRVVLQILEDETDLQKWRIFWAAGVALIRTVGYVLDKVDCCDGPARIVSKAAFKLWKSDSDDHVIFREFIDRERHNILKEYQFNYHPSEEVEIVVVGNAVSSVDGMERQITQVFPIGDNIYRPVLNGFREGDDARDVFSDAIIWWDSQLSRIDAELLAKPIGS